jgi:hypothetical protein
MLCRPVTNHKLVVYMLSTIIISYFNMLLNINLTNLRTFLIYVLLFSNISTVFSVLNKMSCDEHMSKSVASFKPRPLYHL